MTDDQSVLRKFFVKAFGCRGVDEEVESLGEGEKGQKGEEGEHIGLGRSVRPPWPLEQNENMST